jgi:hypothetical protein
VILLHELQCHILHVMIFVEEEQHELNYRFCNSFPFFPTHHIFPIYIYIYLFTHSQNSLPSEPSVYVSTCNVLDVITCIIVDFVLLKCMEHIKNGSYVVYLSMRYSNVLIESYMTVS